MVGVPLKSSYNTMARLSKREIAAAAQRNRGRRRSGASYPQTLRTSRTRCATSGLSPDRRHGATQLPTKCGGGNHRDAAAIRHVGSIALHTRGYATLASHPPPVPRSASTGRVTVTRYL